MLSSRARSRPRSSQLEPAQTRSFVDEDYLDDIAAAFAQVVDSKSPYTSGHSERVTLFADLIAEQLGFSAEAPPLAQARGAAARHRQARRQQLHSRQARQARSTTSGSRCGARGAGRNHPVADRGVRRLAAIAGAHHERLDGKGYPRGLKGDQIPLEIRIVTTADIFDALTADRPYRAAMPVDKALSIMGEMVGTALDPAVSMRFAPR